MCCGGIGRLQLIMGTIVFMAEIVRASDPIELDLCFKGGWVYRLWGPGESCLYVGQTRMAHPWMRISQHKSKPWWFLVKRCDYIQVFDVIDLDGCEDEQISDLHPVYNVMGIDSSHPGRGANVLKVANYLVEHIKSLGMTSDELYEELYGAQA
jgi:hypothetical protein